MEKDIDRKDRSGDGGDSGPGGRLYGLFGFFDRPLGGGDSKLSWGVVLLVAFALYAVYNLVVVVLRIFN